MSQGEALVGYRKNSGFDLTLSAPKSVSLLWGLGDRATAEQVVAAHDLAVLAALAYLEDAACTVRRGKAGSVHHRAGGLVVAAFRHRTSREADPQLHTHLVTANMALGPDGRWTALHSADIWHHSRTAGFIYQSVLRHEVAQRLNVAFEPEKPGIGEVVGIPKPVRREFSRRRVQIEAAMAEHGVRTAHGAQIATLDTRPAKPTPAASTPPGAPRRRSPRMSSGQRGEITPTPSDSTSGRSRGGVGTQYRPTTRRSVATRRSGTPPSTGSGCSKQWPRPRRRASRSSRSWREPTPSSPVPRSLR